MATHYPLRPATGPATPRPGRPFDRLVDAARPLATFFSEFIRHPAMIGSGIPSTPTMVRRMLDMVDWSRIDVLVEYGPGIGSFTGAALARMRPDARLIAIDTSDIFIRHLRATTADPRLHTVAGSAADVRDILADLGETKADCVLSGLPFSTLPAGVGDRIVAETARLLASDGCFLVYQWSPAVRPLLETAFGRIDEAREWRNIPPCRLYAARFD